MKAIYLVLDMQNDLVHVDGPNGKSPMGEQVRNRQVIANTAKALAKARAAGVAVGWVKVGFSPEYQECPKNSPVFGGAPKAGMFKLGGFGTEIHPASVQQPGSVPATAPHNAAFQGAVRRPIAMRPTAEPRAIWESESMP